MLRDETTIVTKLFRMPRDRLADQVLVPAFRQARSVQGAFGWFTSGWVATLAHGLAAYLARPDTDQIEFTVAPVLFSTEYSAVSEAVQDSQRVIQRILPILKEAASPSAEALSRHAAACLAWMIAEERLVLRVAVPKPGVTYHPKVWVFEDGRDAVTVRGSANATGSGCERNVEHMDVDCSWDSEQRVAAAVEMVSDWSRGMDETLEEVCDLPEAIRREIVKLAPGTPPAEAEYLEIIGRGGASVGGSEAAISRHKTLHVPSGLVWKEGRYSHQGDAVRAWEEAGRRGVLAMATGAGKTITALIAATRQAAESEHGLFVVISAPSTPLVQQWASEVRKFGVTPTLPTVAGGKREKGIVLGDALQRAKALEQGEAEIVVVTNATLCAPAFRRSLDDALANCPGLSTLHIGDEAHTLGSEGFIRRPLIGFGSRLGLSATPERQYDDEGTKAILDYFGNVVYEFGLGRAIGFCLVPYEYHVHVALLDGEELRQFKELSTRIGARIAATGGVVDGKDEGLTALIMKRRGIIEAASAKIEVLRGELIKRKGTLRHALIYTSSKNASQLAGAKKAAADLGFVIRQLTQEETGRRGLAESILASFERGDTEIIVAKKVLDEGVDIPNTRIAFLMSSSTVEREWIQRRGRILRMAHGKELAEIHDILALPPAKSSDAAEDNVRSLIGRELDRVRAFAAFAKNKLAAYDRIQDIHVEYFG